MSDDVDHRGEHEKQGDAHASAALFALHMIEREPSHAAQWEKEMRREARLAERCYAIAKKEAKP